MGVAASLRPVEVEVTLAGDTFVIPALPAADWLCVLAEELSVPGMLSPEDRIAVARLIVRGEVDVAELVAAHRDVMEAVTGRRWWVADRLTSGVARSGATWLNLHGAALAAGLDFERVSVAGWCNWLVARALDSLDEKGRDKFVWELERPPLEALKEGFKDEDAEDDFMAVVGALRAGQMT